MLSLCLFLVVLINGVDARSHQTSDCCCFYDRLSKVSCLVDCVSSYDSNSNGKYGADNGIPPVGFAVVGGHDEVVRGDGCEEESGGLNICIYVVVIWSSLRVFLAQRVVLMLYL